MGFVLILVLIFVAAPIARAIAKNIERRGLPRGDEAELRNTLALTEQRLADNETRLAALEEKLDFYEKLLRNPER